MTEKSLWQQIKEVVDCDKAIAELSNDIKTVELALTTDRKQSENQETIVKEKQQAIFKLQKDLQLKELDGKDLKTREDRKRTQLDHASGQKEYMALEREIANLGKQRAALDEDVVTKLYNVDLLKKDLDQFLANKDEHAASLLNGIAAKEENLAVLGQKLTLLTECRDAAVQRLKPEWRTQYERMRHSVPDPIVPALNGSCSACYYAISPQNLIRLKRSDVLPCMGCYRFLYYEAEVAQEANKAEY